MNNRLRSDISAVLHQLEHGEASDGDLRDIAWCAKQLRRALDEIPIDPAAGGAASRVAEDRVAAQTSDANAGSIPAGSAPLAEQLEDARRLALGLLKLHTFDPQGRLTTVEAMAPWGWIAWAKKHGLWPRPDSAREPPIVPLTVKTKRIEASTERT
jgi:hypothetical protein